MIPHGTTWGFYTPPDSSWDKQLTAQEHDPARQTLIEVYSGHGNSEEFRALDAARDRGGRDAHLPRAAPELPALVLARRRDHAPALRERGQQRRGLRGRRAQDARAATLRPARRARWWCPARPARDWLDSGQCRDCFLPAFNYRPRNSVQYITALSNFDEPEGPKRFRFGFIASSDVHSARPGTGYKEYERTEMTEQRGAKSPDQARMLTGEPEAPSLEPRPFDPSHGARHGRLPHRGDRAPELVLADRRSRRGARREPHARRRSGTRSSRRRPTARAARASCSGSIC